jgi:hypothetical protein
MGKNKIVSENLVHEKEHITREIVLGILKTGVVIGLAVFAPGVLKVVDGLTRQKEWERYYPSSIERTIRRLYRKGYVTIAQENGMPVVKISKKGQTEVLRYDLKKMSIPSSQEWDGKWRIVLFDIPEGERRIRNIVRGKLQSMGFYQYQKSVFLYPYPCTKEIEYIREILMVPHDLKLILAEDIENASDLRRHFNLVR